MSSDVVALLDYMEKEKGIERKVLIEAMESAILASARKSAGLVQDLRVEIDEKSGKIRALAKARVVENITSPQGEITLREARRITPGARLHQLVEVEVQPRNFGRIAAQVFKQAYNQQLRSIERTRIYEEFRDRVGTIASGTVRRFERSDVVIDLGRFEGTIPGRERVPTEDYSPGERIRALVLAVENNQRGPDILLSRSHPDFVRKLFELEVNELADGTVEIKGLAREAGYRTKIAVWSDNEKVDPVGACVGLRGARVKNIVRELNNEKVDLFRWSPNIRELVIEALKPAKLKNLVMDEDAKKVTVVVDEDNLSLAIGRRGQNARLTQKLTGWGIDIQREESMEQTFQEQLTEAAEQLAPQLGTDVDSAMHVVRAGFLTIDGIAEASADEFVEMMPDLDPDVARVMYAKVTGETEAPVEETTAESAVDENESASEDVVEVADDSEPTQDGQEETA